MSVNNIFIETSHIALKNLVEDSIVAYNLLWNNTTDYAGSMLDPESPNISGQDPLLGEDYTLLPVSPAIDAGTADYRWQDWGIVNISAYKGTAPDLGCYESF